MSDSEDDEIPVCPLCVEEMDLSDKNFLPCPCGYRVCMWCWHHIRENLNGLCPACRTPYNSDPHAFSAVDRHEIVKKNREKKQREKFDKKVVEKPTMSNSTANAIKSSSSSSSTTTTLLDRKNLHNFRVVQRNLVYVIGLPLSASNEELLRKAEYFGQYGKINKVVVHRNNSISQTTVSAYVTFAYKEDAKAAIQALDSYWMESHQLRASFGTTKYCNNFIRNVPCSNPDCVYLHELGDEDDRFTKEEIQAGHTKLTPIPGKDQSIVTGCGGPSGTGKRPVADTILPPPVFIQDNVSLNKPGLSRNTSINTLLSIPDIKENAEDSAVVAHETPREQVKEEKKDYRDIEILKETIIEESHTSNQNYPEENESFPKDADTQHQQEAPEEDMSSAKFDDNNSYPIKQTSINFQNINSPAFNGITWNAVFPVPSSSLRTSVWSTVLQISHSNLGSNPFEVINIPLSDLLELTLPPVDSTTGSKHNLQLFITPQITNIENSDPISCRTQLAQDLPPIQKQANGLNNANNSSHESTSVGNGQNTTTNGSGSGIHALRQLFPGVNLSYGIQGRF